jgi:hypothetical protein
MQWGGAAVTLASLAALAGCDLGRSGLEGSLRDGGGEPSTHPALDAAANDSAAWGAVDAYAPDGASEDATSAALDAVADACGPASADGGGIVAISEIASPPTIDGDLSDWPCDGWMELNASTAAFVKTGGDPISALVAVRWDASNVYVAVRITDPNVGGNDPTNPYNNDAVEIYATGIANPDGDYDATSHQWVADWKGLVVDYGPSHYGQPVTTAPPYFHAKGIVVTGGWQLEASFGWQVVLPGAFASGSKIGFDVQVDDGDGTQQNGALILALTPTTGEDCGCTQVSCCCGKSVDLPYCDTARMARVTLE